jgi:hypothetical protein
VLQRERRGRHSVKEGADSACRQPEVGVKERKAASTALSAERAVGRWVSRGANSGRQRIEGGSETERGCEGRTHGVEWRRAGRESRASSQRRRHDWER